MNNCVIEDLFELFQYTLILKYFKVQYFHHSNIEDYVIDTNIISLKQFIINDSQIKNFQIIEILLNRMIHLKFFSISSSQIQMINAHRWQNLIEHSLQHLHRFQFCFDYVDKDDDYADSDRIDEDDDFTEKMLKRLEEFQTNFWHEHHWFINYEINCVRALIYTIPYIRQEYQLVSRTNKFITNLNDEKVFDNVRHLTLSEQAINGRTDGQPDTLTDSRVYSLFEFTKKSKDT
jgi:hypothetical protein